MAEQWGGLSNYSNDRFLRVQRVRGGQMNRLIRSCLATRPSSIHDALLVSLSALFHFKN